MTITAALQSANLGQFSSSSSKGVKGQQQHLLSGMDAAGVGAYVDQLLQEFVAAAAAAAAVAVETGESEGSGDEDMQDADAGRYCWCSSWVALWVEIMQESDIRNNQPLYM